MLKNPYVKVQIWRYKFLDWKWPCPPFGTFPKIHPFLYGYSSLRQEKTKKDIFIGILESAFLNKYNISFQEFCGWSNKYFFLAVCFWHNTVLHFRKCVYKIALLFPPTKFLCESPEFVISSWDWGNNKSKQEILIEWWGWWSSFRQNGIFPSSIHFLSLHSLLFENSICQFLLKLKIEKLLSKVGKS